MKELSIEQKAQRYDEAIERAKNTIEVNRTIPNIVECVESLFPELKESEDEKIRKAIIDGLKEMKSSFHTISSIKIDDAIDWLEKQGGQKPADKVEPKFKVGDWVIDKQDIVHQIANVIENVTNHTYGYDIVGGGYFNDNTEGVRLWTIQDAKAGDVLASNHSIFIFSQEYIAGKPEAHCGIMNGLFIVKPGSCWTNEKYYPATKEQRDALMKAITDAGYVFDFEKKELKKIKQSSTINQFTIEQASMLDKHVDKFLEQKTAEPNWVHHKVDLSDCSEEYCKAYYDGWNNCNQQHAQLKAEQKTAEWSEDDEKEVAILEAYIRSKDWSERHIERALGIVDELVNKVKSLRPQPKQEWSKEDEDTIKFLINHFCVSHYNRSFQFTSDKVITCDKLIEKIRNLRPHWKPSDEQIRPLEYAIDYFKKKKNDTTYLESLYQDLKKLTK